MYLPPYFNSNDPAATWDLIRAYPFASLISTDDTGLPYVTHLPLHLEQRGPSTNSGLTGLCLGRGPILLAVAAMQH